MRALLLLVFPGGPLHQMELVVWSSAASPQYFQSYSAAQNYLLSFGHGLIESFGGSFVFASPQA